MTMTILILVFLGLCAGSFITALTWRLKARTTKSKHKSKNSSLSIINGRSMCPNCRHRLSILDLIPVISWIALRGRCRYCRKPINFLQYPLIELTTVILFVSSYLLWPLSLHGYGLFDFIAWLFFLVGFIAIAIYDLRWFIVPNVIVYPLIILGFIYVAVNFLVFKGGASSLIHPLWGAVIISGTFYLLYQLSGGKWIGGGDVKLGFCLGLISWGAVESLLVLFIASFAGTIVSLPFLLSKKASIKMHLPFAPFLILAAIVCQLLGMSVVHHIQN